MISRNRPVSDFPPTAPQLPDPPPPEPAQDAVLLRTAADLVRRGWNRHCSAADAAGASCGYDSREAASFCLIGSVYRVITDAMGGHRRIARHAAFRLAANRLTRYLALALPTIVPMEIALRYDADDPAYGIEARLVAWNDGADACQRSVVTVLEAAADLADHDARAPEGCRLDDCRGCAAAVPPALSLAALEYRVAPLALGPPGSAAPENVPDMSPPAAAKKITSRPEAHRRSTREKDLTHA